MIQQDMKEMEASLFQAKVEASLADGCSWRMCEGAIEKNKVCVISLLLQSSFGAFLYWRHHGSDNILR